MKLSLCECATVWVCVSGSEHVCVCVCALVWDWQIYWWSEKTQPNEMLILHTSTHTQEYIHTHTHTDMYTHTHIHTQIHRAIYLWQLTLLTAKQCKSQWLTDPGLGTTNTPSPSTCLIPWQSWTKHSFKVHIMLPNRHNNNVTRQHTLPFTFA